MNLGSLPQNKALFRSNPLVKFLFLHRNSCQWSGQFHRKRRVPFWRASWDQLVKTKNYCQSSSKDGVPPLWIHNFGTGIHTPPSSWLGRRQARPLVSTPSETCQLVRVAPGAAIAIDWAAAGQAREERERERSRERERNQKVERKTGRRWMEGCQRRSRGMEGESGKKEG